MSDMSSAAISNRESSLLKSREKANEFCSLLCAYRLLDVFINMEMVKEGVKLPTDAPENGLKHLKKRSMTLFSSMSIHSHNI